MQKSNEQLSLDFLKFKVSHFSFAKAVVNMSFVSWSMIIKYESTKLNFLKSSGSLSLELKKTITFISNIQGLSKRDAYKM